MEIGFVVKGGSSDYLSFFAEAEIPAPDNSSSGTSVGNYLTSAGLSSSDLDNISTYQGSIVLDIPAEATGPLSVIFGVGSETLESGTYIEFMVNQAVSVSSDNSTVVFVPTIEEFWLGSNADDNDTNTLQYWFEISGNQNFSDTVSFAFDGSSGSAQVTPMDSGYPSERMGTLYRSVLESGTLTITFASWDGQYSYSYHYDVPGGPTTQVDTYIPSPPNAIVDRYTLVWDQGNWDSQNWQ